MSFRNLPQTYRRIRKGMILLIGGAVLAMGIALIPTPVPALLILPIGLAILGVEYAWARRWAGIAKQAAQTLVAR